MIRYYDDILITKLKRWLPEATNLRVLSPNESKRFFELNAEDTGDQKIQLPCISLSRTNDIELLSTIKQNKSFDGLKLAQNQKTDATFVLNALPIKLGYQLDIYTKTVEEADEYVRNFIFKIVNNPLIRVLIPYQDLNLTHTANIRLLSNISDTSDISERLFPGQFTRWSLQLEIQDAFLFNIPYRKNWKIVEPENIIEVSTDIDSEGEIEKID